MFGKHLVDRGILSEATLLEALERQSRMRVSFGRLAYQLGLMTLDQVMQTLEVQREAGAELRFGAVATKLGFLEAEQVESILATQQETLMPLGQVLATLGYVDPETLDGELRRYLADEPSQETR